MAPGACGSRLAKQCESTSGTSPGQTITLSAHSACCQTPPHPSLSVRFPSSQAPPGRPCALTRRRDISQSLPSLPGISAGPSPPYPPACSTNIPEGQRAAGARAARLSTCLIGVRGRRGLVRVTTPVRSILSAHPDGDYLDGIPAEARGLFFFLRGLAGRRL